MNTPTACSSCKRKLRNKRDAKIPNTVTHEGNGLCAACHNAWRKSGKPDLEHFRYVPGTGVTKTKPVPRELHAITVTVPTAGLPAEPEDAKDRVRLAIGTALDAFGGTVEEIAEASRDFATYTLRADLPARTNPAQVQQAVRQRLALLQKGYC